MVLKTTCKILVRKAQRERKKKPATYLLFILRFIFSLLLVKNELSE